MLVVADERAVGIRRQRRLAGSAEAEEDRSIALRADVRGAMHRHDALGGRMKFRMPNTDFFISPA